MGQREAWPRSRDLLFTFWNTRLISPDWLKIEKLKVRDNKPKNKKMGQKGAWPRSRDLLFKFWDPP